jgi:hypothetical protein
VKSPVAMTGESEIPAWWHMHSARRVRERRCVLAVLVSAVLLAAGVAGAPARASAQVASIPTYPTYWSGIFQADPDGGLGGISCPTSSLCVAYDGAGNVVWSTNPGGGEGVWQVTSVAGDERATSGGISCSAAPVCVAVGSSQMLVSGDPTGGSEAWKVEPRRCWPNAHRDLVRDALAVRGRR